MPSLDINVRNAAPEDAEAIARLMGCLGYHTTAEQMRNRLDAIGRERSYATFVVIANDKLVGVVGACVCPLYEEDTPVGRVVALCVAPATRGSGFGTALVERAERWLREKGVSAVLVNSGNERDDAHAFYTRLGYDATGVRFRKSFK